MTVKTKPPSRLYMASTHFSISGVAPYDARRKAMREAIERQAVGRVCHPTTSVAIFESRRDPRDLFDTIVMGPGELLEDQDRLALFDLSLAQVFHRGLTDDLVFPRGRPWTIDGTTPAARRRR